MVAVGPYLLGSGPVYLTDTYDLSDLMTISVVSWQNRFYLDSVYVS